VPIRTVIAEDNLLVREGVRGLLSSAEDIEVAGVFEDLPGVQVGIRTLEPDVVITDIRMPQVAATRDSDWRPSCGSSDPRWAWSY